MFKRHRRLILSLGLAAVMLFGIVWLTLINLEVGMAKEVGMQVPALPAYDLSEVPPYVYSDAVGKANELVGKSKDKLDTVLDELLSSYMAGRDADIVMFFNSGGWGWNSIEETPGWTSILNGILQELDRLGQRTIVLNYQRTSHTAIGCIKEFFEAAATYPRKAHDLSLRVDFLTDHLPHIKIIVAGESLGTVISDRTMDILKDNTRVYSIQTGTPFWYQPRVLDRKLLMNTNGRSIDTFSYGNLPAMVWATFKGWFGMTSPEDSPGDILNWLKAPGHDYSWQYPGISSAVVDFLETNFPEKN